MCLYCFSPVCSRDHEAKAYQWNALTRWFDFMPITDENTVGCFDYMDLWQQNNNNTTLTFFHLLSVYGFGRTCSQSMLYHFSSGRVVEALAISFESVFFFFSHPTNRAWVSILGLLSYLWASLHMWSTVRPHCVHLTVDVFTARALTSAFTWCSAVAPSAAMIHSFLFLNHKAFCPILYWIHAMFFLTSYSVYLSWINH